MKYSSTFCFIYLSTIDLQKQVSAPGLQIAALSIIDVFSTIITHLPSCALLPVAIEKLTPSIARFFEDAAKKPVNKLYSTQVLQKVGIFPKSKRA